MSELINQHDEEGREHGLCEDYYSNGLLWWRGPYHHGRPHGVWEWYWHGGTLGERGPWHHGVRKGLTKRWDPQGRCTRKEYYLVIR